MATTDQQRKDRIINHMNRDHQRELSHFLRHYASASQSAARSPTIRDLSMSELTIEAQGKEHSVPISPPLASWADARTRFVEMDAVARKALGISDVRLEEYQRPRRIESFIFGAVTFYFLCFATLPWVVPGTRAWAVIDSFFPVRGATGYCRLVKGIFWPVLGIHLVEVVLLDKWRMQPHGVQRFSRLWWMWELSCFFEGFGAFRRSQAIIERKRAEKESKSH